jgi:hypothetical protein
VEVEQPLLVSVTVNVYAPLEVKVAVEELAPLLIPEDGLHEYDAEVKVAGTVALIVTEELAQVKVAELAERVTCGAFEFPDTVAVVIAVQPFAPVTVKE